MKSRLAFSLVVMLMVADTWSNFASLAWVVAWSGLVWAKQSLPPAEANTYRQALAVSAFIAMLVTIFVTVAVWFWHRSYSSLDEVD